MTRMFYEGTKDYLCRYHTILEEMIQGMTQAPTGNSVTENFIRQMIPHHRAAIEMSRNLLVHSNWCPLRRVAQNIIREQTRSIAAMEKALACCKGPENSRQDLELYAWQFDRITQEMFCKMRRACQTNCVNANFIREMIPHHQGAVEMCENALRYCVCPRLKPILRRIIVSQRAGIRQMRRLLRMLE